MSILSKLNFVFKTTFSFFLIITISSCGQPEKASKPTPAPAVSVYSVQSSPIGEYREFVARTVAYREANIRARVEGELIERSFTEGTMVEAEQVLFKIDPAAYLASLTEAKAELQSKEAAAERAKRNLARGKEVAADGYISQSDLDKLTSENSQGIAGVSAAKAALEKAELNLSYTVIKAPFTGRVGKVNYNTGNIVGPNTDALAILTTTDPMYVTFQISESDYISYRQRHVDNKGDARVASDISLRLPNNTDFPYPGKFDFADTKIEKGTGTLELRASFENPDGVILPGLYVTLIFESKDKKQTITVPQVAVQENQQGKFVLVVDENNQVNQRHLTLGRRINAMWVVSSGLSEGERVIIEGVQKVRAGTAVKPVEKMVIVETGAIVDLVK